jgi:hypothetical protein
VLSGLQTPFQGLDLLFEGTSFHHREGTAEVHCRCFLESLGYFVEVGKLGDFMYAAQFANPLRTYRVMVEPGWE